MNLKIFFDFHDIFVDAKSAWIKALKQLTESKEEVEKDYNSGLSKKIICKKYNLDYEETEELYRNYLNPINENIDFAKKLSGFYKINILSLSKKSRLLSDMQKFGIMDIFDTIISKDDISKYNSKDEYLNSISSKYDWILYFNHEQDTIIQNGNIIYLPINLQGDLSKFRNISFTEHAKNKLLYNDLSKYYMYAIANDTSLETNFLSEIYKKHGLPENGKILDCCCGVGRHDYLLANAGYQVTGIDISEEQITNAKKFIVIKT